MDARSFHHHIARCHIKEGDLATHTRVDVGGYPAFVAPPIMDILYKCRNGDGDPFVSTGENTGTASFNHDTDAVKLTAHLGEALEEVLKRLDSLFRKLGLKGAREEIIPLLDQWPEDWLKKKKAEGDNLMGELVRKRKETLIIKEPHALLDRNWAYLLGLPTVSNNAVVFTRATPDSELEIIFSIRAKMSSVTAAAESLTQRKRKKPILDIVGGGQPYNTTLVRAVAMEAMEEFNIRSVSASRGDFWIKHGVQQAVIRSIGYFQASRLWNKMGLRRETVHCFSMEVPKDFVPTSNDGTSTGFVRINAREILEVLQDKEKAQAFPFAFKKPVPLALIRFFIAEGFIKTDDPGFAALVDGLENGPAHLREHFKPNCFPEARPVTIGLGPEDIRAFRERFPRWWPNPNRNPSIKAIL